MIMGVAGLGGTASRNPALKHCQRITRHEGQPRRGRVMLRRFVSVVLVSLVATIGAWLR